MTPEPGKDALQAVACGRETLAATQVTARNGGPSVSSIFDYIHHPRHEERKLEGPPKVAAAAQLHGPGPLGRFNAKVGLKITVIAGTMWCAYLFPSSP